MMMDSVACLFQVGNNFKFMSRFYGEGVCDQGAVSVMDMGKRSGVRQSMHLLALYCALR